MLSVLLLQRKIYFSLNNRTFVSPALDIRCEDLVLRSEPNTSVNKSSDGANERNSDISDDDDVGNLSSLPPATQTSGKIILTEEDIPGTSIQDFNGGFKVTVQTSPCVFV